MTLHIAERTSCHCGAALGQLILFECGLPLILCSSWGCSDVRGREKLDMTCRHACLTVQYIRVCAGRLGGALTVPCSRMR